MLKINHSQMIALENSQRHGFLSQLSKEIQRQFPNQLKAHGIAAPDTLHFVSTLAERAESYGIDFEEDVRFFVSCALLLEPDFDQSPRHAWAGEVLARTDLSVQERLDAISDQLLFAGETPL